MKKDSESQIMVLEELVILNKCQSEYFLWYHNKASNLFFKRFLKRFSDQRIQFIEELENFLKKEKCSTRNWDYVPTYSFLSCRNRNKLSYFRSVCREKQESILKAYSKKLAGVNKANMREILLRHMFLIKKEVKSLQVIEKYTL